jgi:acyl carrier protein
MLTREEIERRTRELMVEFSWAEAADEAHLPNEAKLGADLGVDSLDLVEMVMEIEKEFNVGIPDDELDGRFEDHTVNDVFDLAERHVSLTFQAA